MPGDYRHQTRRHSSGQAIAEGAVALWLLVTAFVLMVALGINLFFLTQWTGKVNLVAAQAAKVIAINKYWLGMIRRDYKEADTQAKAKTVAQNLCTKLGLPQPSGFTFTSTSDTTGDYNQVVVTVSGLPLPFQLGNVFPNFTSVSGTGVDFEPTQQIYAALHISAVKAPYDAAPKHPTGMVNVAVLPAYGFYTAKSPNYKGEIDPQSETLSQMAPKYLRGLPLGNEFLNGGAAPPQPLEFDARLLSAEPQPDGQVLSKDNSGEYP